MKKIIATLFFAFLFITAGLAYADFLNENPQRYHEQGRSADGNWSFIDKSTIKHHSGELTTYTGILRLSNTSKLFNSAKSLVKETQVPLYVVSVIMIDCSGERLKTGSFAVVGVDIADDTPKAKILWSDKNNPTEWSVIPNGLEPRAKALLCGPSF